MSALILDVETVPIDDVLTYLEPVSAPENYKDKDKIAAYIAEKTQSKADKASLDPDLCRIVCFGVMTGSRVPITKIAKDEHEERQGLAWLAQLIESIDATIITFNGFRFDLPVIMRRAWYLGIKMRAFNIDRYRSTHVDLWQKLTFNGAIDGHTLGFYAQRLGLPGDLEVRGDQIADLARRGEWDTIARHCRQDVLWTAGIAERFGYWNGPIEASQPPLADVVGF